MPRLKAPLLLLSLAAASAPALLSAQAPNPALAGSLNFATGQVNIDGRPLNTNTPLQPQHLQAGQTLATANGSADLLLAPGALLRLGQDSTLQMVTADNGRTEVRLEAGVANIDTNVVRPDHLLLLDLRNGQTQLLSRGLYAFNAGTDTVRVFHGEADLFAGADTTTNVKPVAVKEGHEVIVGGNKAKPEKFDRELADNDLLPWTGPREEREEDGALDGGAASRHGTGAAFTGSDDGGFGDPGYGGGFGYGGGYGYGLDSAGFYPGGFGLGYGFGPYGGWDYPFGYGAFGFAGYPFGFGFGGGYYGYGGYYGGGRAPNPFRGGGYRGVTPHNYGRSGFAGGGARAGFAGGGRGFAGGGGFHGGGGGFHGGGGHR